MADDSVRFHNLSADPDSGLIFQRARSATAVVMDELRQRSLSEPVQLQELAVVPYNTDGQPGIAIFDYDGDGDLDIYVTNGPGAANSLFSNQLQESGEMRFIDVAQAAGVAAKEQDGMGVCYGDTDNDGDSDLLVLGRDEPNRFFENLGKGSFREVPNSGLEAGHLSSPSCSLGDVDQDGLLDVVIANAYDHGDLLSCLVEPFALNQHNQLFLNRGGNRFEDVSSTAGIEELTGFVPPRDGGAGITWAVSVVDVDLDGDGDIIFADDQCGMLEPIYGGEVDRGLLHVMLNDGTGHYTDSPMLDSPFPSSSWMGLGFGDLNCDGHLDIYGSNFGDYADHNLNQAYIYGQQASRALYGNGDGTFTDRGVGSLGASVLAWGNAIFDYDNDGDQDVITHGGLDFATAVPADNPGTLLQNQGCSGDFVPDKSALVSHERRIVQAVAIGDLDRNGFVDIVTASSFNLAPEVPMVLGFEGWGSDLDADAFIALPWSFTPEGLVWNGVDRLPGDLVVELNGGNGNGSITVQAIGSSGLTEAGRVNRSGIGAVISVTPAGGTTAITPVQGGSSFASQHSLEATFGLGSADQAVVDVLWPGGVRNRIYGVRAGERIVLPEIPCDFTADWRPGAFHFCVARSLADLSRQGAISSAEKGRLLRSMFRAFREARRQ